MLRLFLTLAALGVVGCEHGDCASDGRPMHGRDDHRHARDRRCRRCIGRVRARFRRHEHGLRGGPRLRRPGRGPRVRVARGRVCDPDGVHRRRGMRRGRAVPRRAMCGALAGVSVRERVHRRTRLCRWPLPRAMHRRPRLRDVAVVRARMVRPRRHRRRAMRECARLRGGFGVRVRALCDDLRRDVAVRGGLRVQRGLLRGRHGGASLLRARQRLRAGERVPQRELPCDVSRRHRRRVPARRRGLRCV